MDFYQKYFEIKDRLDVLLEKAEQIIEINSPGKLVYSLELLVILYDIQAVFHEYGLGAIVGIKEGKISLTLYPLDEYLCASETEVGLRMRIIRSSYGMKNCYN